MKDNIFVLPSYTEGHNGFPEEIKKKPVVIFDEIKHVMKNKKIIFFKKNFKFFKIKSILKKIIKKFKKK